MGEIQAGGSGDYPLDAVDPLYVCETCGQAQKKMPPDHKVAMLDCIAPRLGNDPRAAEAPRTWSQQLPPGPLKKKA